jgi:chromosome segregation ATPase
MATHTERERRTGRSDVSYDSSDEDTHTDWKDRASVLEKENGRLRNQISELEDEVETLKEEGEKITRDLIHQSQMTVDYDNQLYKRIGDFTRQTLFRHIKFITSNGMLHD